jgi:hypothetical protein
MKLRLLVESYKRAKTEDAVFAIRQSLKNLRAVKESKSYTKYHKFMEQRLVALGKKYRKILSEENVPVDEDELPVPTVEEITDIPTLIKYLRKVPVVVTFGGDFVYKGVILLANDKSVTIMYRDPRTGRKAIMEIPIGHQAFVFDPDEGVAYAAFPLDVMDNTRFVDF